VQPLLTRNTGALVARSTAAADGWKTNSTSDVVAQLGCSEHELGFQGNSLHSDGSIFVKTTGCVVTAELPLRVMMLATCPPDGLMLLLLLLLPYTELFRSASPRSQLKACKANTRLI
jgi:hypothetical protein